ncbi:hypothetical protein, partial [Acidaminobacter sp.]|uniref:hypothetical protein n=1 Tax=Acidaminobacter sp. TaxID=1872102 RepID=UPI0025C525E7
VPKENKKKRNMPMVDHRPILFFGGRKAVSDTRLHPLVIENSYRMLWHRIEFCPRHQVESCPRPSAKANRRA